MKANLHNPYDVLIAGSGFAGSLTALVLHQIGLKVCLLEKEQHPRFAIGESSTPVADMILRDLARTYDLPWLYSFSRYGSWQQSHPELVCGIKRGFSFFKHHPGTEFFTDSNHENELLVAASSDDILSDTNWLRADFDAFLVERVKESGIDYFDRSEIAGARRDSLWEFTFNMGGESGTIRASFLIDATGSSTLLSRLLGVKSSPDGFQTHSFSVFSHFLQVPEWTGLLQEAGYPTRDYPYHADHSALNHILDEGWAWMLRFNDQRCSLGFVLDTRHSWFREPKADIIWQGIREKYPSINRILQGAVPADPPGKLMRTPRLQRRIDHGSGPGWTVLPHTAGFVDPLFSPGIAHSLSGVEKLARIFSQHWGTSGKLSQKLQEYEQSIFDELSLIDYLVSGCYRSMGHFDLFISWSMLYFALTLAHERERRDHGSLGNYLDAGNPQILKIVQDSYAGLLNLLHPAPASPQGIRQFDRWIREKIKPFDPGGLLEPAATNMYWHTAASL